MAKLSEIDKKANEKGSGLETLWQFIKFIIVSLGAFVIQSCLPLLLKLPMSDEFLHRAYSFWIFSSKEPNAEGVIEAGLGVFIAATVSNILAQIFSFFVNRKTTFNSDANIAVTLPIYIVFTLALISFSAWLQPTLITAFTASLGQNLAITVSGAICGAIQFFIYFPVSKLLFPKKKEEAASEEK